MFGQDDTSSTQSDDISAVNPTLNGTDTSTPATDDAAAAVPAPDTTVTPSDTPVVDTPVVDTPPADTPTVPDVPEVTETPEEPAAPEVDESSDTPSTSADDDDLLALKKQALEELTPLLDKLDQTPEEKFRTTMMMIQATDSDSLIKSAHEAALAITDEKVRAQALLDIVNEINYFTQPKE